MSEPTCRHCLIGACEMCDSTVWAGSVPTYCRCWAGGHPYPGGEVLQRPPELDPDIPDEDARMDAYERGRE